MESYQLTFDFDPEKLEFLGVLNSNLNDFGFKNLAAGSINHLWLRPKNQPVAAGQMVFNLMFKAKKDGLMSQSVGVSSKFTAAAAYKTGEAEEKKLPIALRYRIDETPPTVGVSEGAANVFHGISPNPTAGRAMASFNLPEEGMVEMTVTDGWAAGFVEKGVVRGRFRADAC